MRSGPMGGSLVGPRPPAASRLAAQPPARRMQPPTRPGGALTAKPPTHRLQPPQRSGGADGGHTPIVSTPGHGTPPVARPGGIVARPAGAWSRQTRDGKTGRWT